MHISKESIESSIEVFGHGNLYFSVDIVYPWAIYYLYVLQVITDIPCDQSWFEKLDYPYDEYQAEHDMALIQYFVQLLWGCVKTVLPPQGLQSSLGLYADFQPHRLLHFVPGLIRAVAQLHIPVHLTAVSV